MTEDLFCPECGSENIEPKHEDIWGFSKNPGLWICNNCGYNGVMPKGNPNDYEVDTDFESEEEIEVKSFNKRQIGIFLIILGVLFGAIPLII